MCPYTWGTDLTHINIHTGHDCNYVCTCIGIFHFCIHTHTCGHISTHIEAYTLLRLRSCVHTHVDVIRLMPRYTCGMRESLGLCVHKIVGKSHMWNVGIIGLICAYPYVQDGAYVYVHENVVMIVLTCIHVGTIKLCKILLWLSHPHPKPQYKHNFTKCLLTSWGNSGSSHCSYR